MPRAQRRIPKRATQKRRNAETQKLVVTIDGPAGCGKSTVAKRLAGSLGLTYLDTGATYRALALAALQEDPPVVADAARLADLARQLPIRLEAAPEGQLRVFLGDDEVTKKIRTEQVTEVAAHVSQFPEVRAAMVERQRELAQAHGVVVEGRDTGSVVFPQAAYKFFLDADPAVRAKRRQQELCKLYGSQTPLAMVREQIELRDGLDRSRTAGPLVKPPDAVLIDTTKKTVEGVVREMLRAIRHTRRP